MVGAWAYLAFILSRPENVHSITKTLALEAKKWLKDKFWQGSGIMGQDDKKIQIRSFSGNDDPNSIYHLRHLHGAFWNVEVVG